jgi:hypothetical protein
MYITNKQCQDGFGSQFQHIIACILISMKEKYEFYYTPLQDAEHNYDNDPSYLEKLENLMNIRDFFPTIDAVDDSNKTRITQYEGEEKKMIDADITKYANEENLHRIRVMFWDNKPDRDSFFNYNKCYNVAVHVRRVNPHDNKIFQNLNFGQNSSYDGRFFNDKYFLNRMATIRQWFKNYSPDKQIMFHVYSQSHGGKHNFDAYSQHPDVMLHIDEDITTTFMGMVSADMLVTSPSSMSYIAGYFNLGVVIASPFWHATLPHWKYL